MRRPNPLNRTEMGDHYFVLNALWVLSMELASDVMSPSMASSAALYMFVRSPYAA